MKLRWNAKRQLNENIEISPIKTSTANYVARQDSYETPALTSSLENVTILALTSHLTKGDTTNHGTAPPAPTVCTASSASTSPGLFIPTPALAHPYPSSPAPQQWTSTLQSNK